MTAPTRPRIKPIDLTALRLLAVDGDSTEQAANKLGMTPNTLAQRIIRLRHRLGAGNNMHAVVTLIEMGLLDLGARGQRTCGVSWQFRRGLSVGPCVLHTGHDALHRDASDAQWPNTWPASGVQS